MQELPEFSINVQNLPPADEWLVLPVKDNALEIIASECGLTACRSLEARFRAKRYRKHGVTLTGRFTVSIEQECVVTLEPVFTDLQEEFQRRFLPERDLSATLPEIIDGEMVFDPEAEDLPDLLEGGQINLWEVLIEEMILAIDPFPRSEQAVETTLPGNETGSEDESEPTHNPFSELKSLISEKKSNK